MLKRFLSGLIFGTGFAVAFFAILAAALYFVFPVMIRNGMVFTAGPEEEVHAPPGITHRKKFLGTSGAYSRGFPSGANRVLSPGPGRIVGLATVDDKPLEGLRLRLALNGSVMSQWATTGADGQYAIGVPYGEYRVDGFSLDTETADSVLAGKIGHPRNPYSGGTFEVAEGVPGDGLNLKFVDPVVLNVQKNRFAASEDIVIRWKPYPGAKEYVVQIYERADPNMFGGNDVVFPWSERPVVNEPMVNLSDYDVDLKAGHYYSVSIEARAEAWLPISRTADRFGGYDFKVVE